MRSNRFFGKPVVRFCSEQSPSGDGSKGKGKSKGNDTSNGKVNGKSKGNSKDKGNSGPRLSTVRILSACVGQNLTKGTHAANGPSLPARFNPKK